MPLVEHGQHLGSWVLDTKIGAGGNGEVWRASGGDQSSVALKVLQDARPTHVSLPRFAREVAIVQGLGVRNGVVPILDSHVPEMPSRRERVWYAMPEAQLLAHHLAERPVNEVVVAVRDLARVLCQLKDEFGIAHRDLKPGNLFWLDGPALSDFGLVHLPDATPLTEPGRIPGSFGFIADEVMLQDAEVDWPLADVFSLAKVLWVLLTPGSIYPPQGSLSADGGPASLARTLTIPKADELDRILAAATRHHSERIPMEAFGEELDAWFSTVAPPEDDSLGAAVEAARASMAATFSNRDGIRRRQTDGERSLMRLREATTGIEATLVRVDPNCAIGSHAIGGFSQWIEQAEYMGGPSIETTYHHGFRISRGDDGLGLILLIAFCLQIDEDGLGYVEGIMMSGYEELSGGTHFQLPTRKAQVGSVQLDRNIEEIVAEAKAKLPELLEAFSRGH